MIDTVLRPCRVSPDLPGLADQVARALAEDVGRGDLTTRLTVPAEMRARASLIQKSPGVLAGAPVFEAVFALVPGEVSIAWLVEEGSVSPGPRTVAELEGSARALLTGERTALNYLQRLSGIATLAARAAEIIAPYNVTLLDTRKTTPGLRLLEKYATRVGGARNHRFGLDDGILIKDNHIVAAGGITAAVQAARAGAPPGMLIEVEVTTFAELDEALAAGADIILLDNWDPADLRRAIEICDSADVWTEVSGGISLETIARYAAARPDFISMGALTHSATALDFSLDFVMERPAWSAR
ncbi:MAG: carboxylating nicotinate-nucleotide diphosphorylase [Chloroflexota bacterium]|nr:carboxylating nicotinate-nucleotide diphosphorylase [Dehalococcoidia bacterium]MDW8252974.1 carboxylating nicotinate-nucleotide diphosphorylase [Chloroflexota bacterium]